MQWAMQQHVRPASHKFELDRVPDMHMTGRVYVVERSDVVGL